MKEELNTETGKMFCMYMLRIHHPPKESFHTYYTTMTFSTIKVVVLICLKVV